MDLKIVTNGGQVGVPTLALHSDVRVMRSPSTRSYMHTPHTHKLYISQFSHSVMNHMWLSHLPIVTKEDMHSMLYNICMVELQNDKSESYSRKHIHGLIHSDLTEMSVNWHL